MIKKLNKTKDNNKKLNKDTNKKLNKTKDMYDNMYETTVTNMYKENLIQMVINWTLLTIIKTRIEAHNHRNLNATHFANSTDNNIVTNSDKEKHDNTMNILTFLYKGITGSSTLGYSLRTKTHYRSGKLCNTLCNQHGKNNNQKVGKKRETQERKKQTNKELWISIAITLKKPR